MNTIRAAVVPPLPSPNVEPDTTFTDEWVAPTIEALLSAGVVATLRADADGGESLWRLVVRQGLLSDQDILDAVATRFRLNPADFSMLEHRVRDSVPEAVARRYHVVPLRVTDSYLDIATANPFDLDAEKSLAFATGRSVRMYLAPPAVIQERLDELYRPEQLLDRILEGVQTQAEVTQIVDELPEEITISEQEATTRPIVRLVDLILSEGIGSRASDIHIETEEGGVAVRYRIDGVLRQVMKIPRRAGLPLISRIKIISGLDIADRLRPQDGRARVAVNGTPVDLRVSTLPATLGEKVVIRILDSRTTILALDSLGFHDEEAELLRSLLRQRDGVILVTGPTGSGKTTTLYAAIREVQSEGVNIVTVEDPVEYRIPGVVQVQVHEKAGLTFASALRSILRQDPDVVLVGEVRDRETSEIAVQASLTGHLVLSTLHTNDAANAVTRLVDIGVEAYKIGSALRGVIAQRLVRRLCQACRQPFAGPFEERFRPWIPEGTGTFRAVGCPECAMTGYRGRFAIVEVLLITPELERLIGEGATADRIAEAGLGQGRSLWESGLRHVLRGETALEELERVVEVPTPAARPAAKGPVSPSKPAPAVAEPIAPPNRETPPTELEPTGHFELLDGLESGDERERGTVLLVEDEDQLRRVLKDLLERDGFTVAEARDGAEALVQVDRLAPDAVVLDLNLPGLDGYGVLTRLRAQPATASVPVLVLTAKGDEDNEVRVFQLGADDFLTKPFRARALAARLDSMLTRRRAR